MKVEIFNVAEITPESTEQKLQFNKFKRDEHGIYQILCPSHKSFKAEQILGMKHIPERIIEVVERSRDMFYEFEIWEAESASEKDPILLGREKTLDKDGKERDRWYDEIYLLARWGQELENFDVLKKRAIESLSEPVKIELMKIKAKVDFYLSDVPLFMRDAIKNGSTSIPSFNEGCLSRF